MTTETPQQRRTRLIEQYAGLIYTESAHHDFKYADTADFIMEATHNAKLLADAVIAATPQDPQAIIRYPSEIETALLEDIMTIKTLLDRRNYKTATDLAAQIVAKHKELLSDV